MQPCIIALAQLKNELQTLEKYQGKGNLHVEAIPYITLYCMKILFESKDT